MIAKTWYEKCLKIILYKPTRSALNRFGRDKMKKNSHPILNPIIFLAILFSMIGWLSPSATAIEYTFTTIDYPGARNTNAFGINDSGKIVGNCDDVPGRHGFLATPVPEHSTMLLLGFGLLGLLGLRRRFKKLI